MRSSPCSATCAASRCWGSSRNRNRGSRPTTSRRTSRARGSRWCRSPCTTRTSRRSWASACIAGSRTPGPIDLVDVPSPGRHPAPRPGPLEKRPWITGSSRVRNDGGCDAGPGGDPHRPGPLRWSTPQGRARIVEATAAGTRAQVVATLEAPRHHRRRRSGTDLELHARVPRRRYGSDNLSSQLRTTWYAPMVARRDLADARPYWLRRAGAPDNRARGR